VRASRGTSARGQCRDEGVRNGIHRLLLILLQLQFRLDAIKLANYIHPSIHRRAPFRDGAAKLSTVSLSPFSLPTFFPPTTRYSTTTTQGNVYNLTYNDIHPSIHLTIDTTANSTSQRHTVKKSRDKKEKTAGIPTFADSKRKLIRLMAPPCPLRLAYVQMPGGAF
jgi:hypothetical protein